MALATLLARDLQVLQSLTPGDFAGIDVPGPAFRQIFDRVPTLRWRITQGLVNRIRALTAQPGTHHHRLEPRNGQPDDGRPRQTRRDPDGKEKDRASGPEGPDGGVPVPGRFFLGNLPVLLDSLASVTLDLLTNGVAS